MRLYPEYYHTDRHVQPGEEPGYCDALEVDSPAGRLIGFLLTPNHVPGEKHPAVIMLHGFPGHTTNHDLGQALRRVGFVVLNPYAPGAWGSGGNYTFDGLIDAACAVAGWLRSEEIAEKYHVDTDNIFLFGHSMGGFTAVNVMRRLSWLRGGVLCAPYDYPWFFENGREQQEFAELLPEGRCLRTDSPTALYDNAKAVYQTLAFSQAAADLRGKTLLFVGGRKDTVAPPDTMIEPLYRALCSTTAEPDYVLLDSDHSFNDHRIKLCKIVCQWLAEHAEG